MPRDGNGNYTLPLPPVVADTTIESNVENSTNTDLAQALTDSLSRSGSGGMQVQMKVIDGNVTDPGLQFVSESQTGFYRAASGDMRNTLLGVDQWRVTSTGFEFWDHGTAMWAVPVSQVDFDALDGAVVKIAGAQTITGAKTFNAVLTMGSVKITGLADATVDADAVNKKLLDVVDAKADTNATDIGTLQTADGQNVKITGNQTVAGEKTFNDQTVILDDVGIGTSTPNSWADFNTLTINGLVGGGGEIDFEANGVLVSSIWGDAVALNIDHTTGKLILAAATTCELWGDGAQTARISQAEAYFTVPDFLVNAEDAWADLHLNSSNADPSVGGRIYFKNSNSGGNDPNITGRPGATGNMQFFINGSNRALFGALGNIQFPILAGAGNRAVYSTPDGSLTNSASDERLKDSIWESPYGLNAVMAMRPVTYRWKDKAKGEQTELGFIAQDMNNIVPEVIGENSDGMLSLDYPKLVAVMAKAIQELTARVEELENG